MYLKGLPTTLTGRFGLYFEAFRAIKKQVYDLFDHVGFADLPGYQHAGVRYPPEQVLLLRETGFALRPQRGGDRQIGRAHV